MKQTFNEFLEQKFIDENPTILDDDMPDGFSDWLGDQGVDLIIAYSEKWHLEQILSSINAEEITAGRKYRN